MTIITLIIAFFISLFIIPLVIKVFRSINLLDLPDNRKIHLASTPSMGGIALFISVFTCLLFFVPFAELSNFKFFLAGVVLMFILGLRDDIAILSADQKLVIQIIAAFMTARYTDIRIEELHGLFGIHTLPYWSSIIFTVFAIVAMTNAFNLIDGIDGLAGSIAFITATVLGIWFIYNENTFFVILCLSLASSVAAFLIFNWYPSKIFMGDTGSIVLGFTLTVTSLFFIQQNHALADFIPHKFSNPVPFALSLLIVPFYDTLRVFSLRIISGSSPFVPDRRHIHHSLLRQGYTHGQATTLLIVINLFLLFTVYFLQFLPIYVLLLGSFGLMVFFGYLIDTGRIFIPKSFNSPKVKNQIL